MAGSTLDLTTKLLYVHFWKNPLTRNHDGWSPDRDVNQRLLEHGAGMLTNIPRLFVLASRNDGVVFSVPFKSPSDGW